MTGMENVIRGGVPMFAYKGAPQRCWGQKKEALRRDAHGPRGHKIVKLGIKEKGQTG